MITDSRGQDGLRSGSMGKATSLVCREPGRLFLYERNALYYQHTEHCPKGEIQYTGAALMRTNVQIVYTVDALHQQGLKVVRIAVLRPQRPNS